MRLATVLLGKIHGNGCTVFPGSVNNAVIAVSNFGFPVLENL